MARPLKELGESGLIRLQAKVPAYVVSEMDADIEIERTTRSEYIRLLIEQDRKQKDRDLELA